MERPTSLIDLYRIGLGDEPYDVTGPATPEEMLAVHILGSLRSFKPVDEETSAERRRQAESAWEHTQVNIMRFVDADQSPWKLVSLLGRHLYARVEGLLLGNVDEMNAQNQALFAEMGGEKFSTIKESHRFIYLLVWLALVENDSSFRDTTPVADWERAVEEYKGHNMPDYQARLECLYRHHP